MAVMRLTTFTDYTLRTLIYLAGQQARLSTVAEIAAAHGISQHHLTKVVYRLGLSGVIRTVRGRNGGIALARPACEICVGQVVRDSEPDFYMADCFDTEHATCRYAGHCRVEDVLGKATDAFLATLDAVTLADLVLST
ncbi:transcriptional regulator, BadM/Rrf2 family [Duganella sp. OV458]|jgi:Rrf2 family nitric oxide-sensitive transcriptional repressor|nr:transcriptional regulator, BadM/Rrf2 family [Duganella sp. OV458]SDJ61706.1 transcriptional regulator, BadM/Rrf2 family [Duganella sp. OV510]